MSSILLSFYQLLPEIIRTRDRLASGLVGEAGEGNLEKLVYMLDQVAQQTVDDNEVLGESIDPDLCIESLFPYMSSILGEAFVDGWSMAKKRNFIRGLGLLYKVKATRRSWKSILNMRGYLDYFPWELWKADLYEKNGNYTLTPAYYSIKSARVDLRQADMSYLSAGRPEWLESFRPIHVLIRLDQSDTELLDHWPSVGEGVDTEYTCGSAPEEEDTSFADEDLVIAETCTTWSCEIACQLSCTGSCETFCQAGGCEVACQTFCEGTCQTDCMYVCQSGCQESCETDCQASCELTCEVGCESFAELNPTWYSEDWLYRKKITIPAAQVPAIALDFPAVINVTDVDLGPARADGRDFVVTDSTGLVKLKTELEKWDATSKLTLWFKTDLSAVAANEFYLYYGYLASADQHDPTNVWDANFVAVWHLPDDGPFGVPATIEDSLGVTDLTSSGWPTMTQTTGQVDGSLTFDGTQDYLEKITNDWRSADHIGTISAWVKPTNFAAFMYVLSSCNSGSNNWIFGLATQATSGKPYVYRKSGAADTIDYIVSDDAVTSGVWNHLVMVSDGSAYNYYIDGSVVSGVTVSGGANDGHWFADTTTRQNVAVGVRHTSAAYQYYWKGGLDEIKVSNIERSADWIATEYNNQDAPGTFMTWGAEEVPT
jgi:hypothetical protein